MTEILLRGMHGLGDNLHQRAVVRQYLQRYDTVYLESSWITPYWDLMTDGRLKIVRKPTPLRTQTKNAEREADGFHPHPGEDTYMPSQRIWYRPEDVRKHRSVLKAMLANSGCDPDDNDFSMPINPDWPIHIPHLERPGLVVRPLIERTEWGGCSARNPDFGAYAKIFRALAKSYYTISVADLEPGKEWLVGEPLHADAILHYGQLPFEEIATLFKWSDLVLTSPGFAVPLAQAVGTPVICVFGGYECSYSFSAGGKYLGIDPITPCDDFKHGTHHNKTINMVDAFAQIGTFLDDMNL